MVSLARILIEAAEDRFRAFGGLRAGAALDRNALAHHAWRACGYVPQADWSRWTRWLRPDP